ncbi:MULTISPECIES: LutB/LldF family L-lactate oxidation iron-sulfur protein [Sphingobacterium]|jgi:L-lactate dehydrogenase complex protein LldF|uniref:LutB/LldF family L-lactate oxidation iron-sulfur protein n=1 Tax=Sphingobacterium TaxID=28453 RepID=UPI0004E5F679|nr:MULTISPECIES: LutB/LldF family L-lactate oxidation iron-sulfur protein [Sphingobacterium]CDS92074.1 Lactate utilization protein B [Sphingobacterium sp. PM2-P1-29]SJN50595.1 Predicted L-lactate dehydrogenase, Iron-sulfur cluster-binding subunit YkgF [Sphingobacterium faecium PCAi_F2.5]HCU44434.1 iron-sulfur cluster-binding protein [Sphingobacterium sp.]UPZ36857.1 LutB/LldF family L-lactate oxidation iron-sulfur protein [Sphingobacterium sp. PCS056]UXD68381.1 LutB/LldF family L-lactate oxidat
MSVSSADKFLKESATKSFDSKHRDIINYNIDKYTLAFEKGKSKFVDLENSRLEANLTKWRAIENLDQYLLEFESKFIARGGKVIWANDAAEARQEIWKIMERNNAKSVIKSKSMATEEIELNHFLENKGIEALESDLGEFIIQLLDQKPYHIVTPAMHLSLADIAQLFNERFGTPLEATAEELTMKARELLREKYKTADIGISGANFLIADTGSIAITENEGNARLTTAFPKIHIAVVGIEKILPSINDLDLFWPLLATHGTGQNLTVYNTLLSGPRQAYESDGPEEMYVVLLDNGRTNLLAQKEQRQGLYCIRCGACLNVCPIYQNIGGHTYETTYQGPIGSLISPHLSGMKEFKHLSYASSLCGKCTEVCPVGIDIQRMLLLNRRDAVAEDLAPSMEKKAWKGFTYLIQRRKLIDLFGGKIKNFFLGKFFKKTWGSNRQLPKLADKSFSKQWKEQQKNKD